jgi:hypothetical protein
MKIKKLLSENKLCKNELETTFKVVSNFSHKYRLIKCNLIEC